MGGLYNKAQVCSPVFVTHNSRTITKICKCPLRQSGGFLTFVLRQRQAR